MSRADDVREQVKIVAQQIGAKYRRLGELLKEVRDKEYWREWGYESFEAYCEQEIGYRDRKVRYLISTVEGFERAGVTEQEAAELDPSKAAIIADARGPTGAPLLTSATKEEWIQKAKTLKTDELRREVARAAGRPVSDEAPKPWTAMLFPGQQVIVEQAYERAKRLAGDDNLTRGSALELICADFLAGPPVGEPTGEAEPVDEPAPEEIDG